MLQKITLFYLLSFCASVLTFGQNCPQIQNLPDTIDYCAGGMIQLNPGLGATTNTFLGATWTPSAGLNNPNFINPTLTVGTAAQKYRVDILTATNTNLVVNGDFSTGNTGFTSAYTLGTGGPFGACSNPGTYGVSTSGNLMHSLWPSFGDHTTGTGQMLCLNGSMILNTDVWCQTFPVSPNSIYDFSAWSAVLDGSGSTALQFKINGTLIGSQFNVGVGGVPWARSHIIWNSGTSTSATICITSFGTSYVGNDFAIDDIAFNETCVSSDSVWVRIVPGLTAAATSNAPVCNGDTLKLFTPAVYGAVYTWTGPNSFLSFAQNPVVPNVSSINSGTYNLSVSGSPGCGGSSSVTAAVVAKPVIGGIVITHPTICGVANGSITLTGLNANTNYAISYTVNNVTITLPSQTSSGLGVVVISGLFAGSYSNIVVARTGCPSLPVGPVILVNPVPGVLSVSSNSPVCIGSNLTITASAIAGATYSWAGPNGYASSQQSNSIGNATAAMSGTYTVNATLNGCSLQPASVNVLVSPVPPAPVVSNMTYCQNATAGPLTAAGQNLLWYTVPVGGSPIPTPTVTTSTPNSFTVYVSQTVNGCESPRNAITVTVTAQAPPPVVASPVNYCEGAATSPLTATGQGLRWYTQATGGTGSTTIPTPSSATVSTTTWYVTQSINGVCESQRVPIDVIINPIPAVPVVVSPVHYCRDDNASVLKAQGQNLLWYQQSAGGSGSSLAPLPNTAVPGTASYYVSQSVNGCESDRSKIDVIVDEKVIAQISGNNSSVCQFDSIAIINDATNPISATYTWNFDNASVLSGSGAGPYLLKWSAEGTKAIMLTVTNGACSVSDTMVLMLQPSPIADFELGDDICVEEMITVQAAWNSLSGSIYHWDFGGANVILGSGAGFYRMNWHTAGLKVVSLFVSNVNGCHSDLILDTIMVHELLKAEILSASASVCIGDTVHFEARDLGNGYSYVWKPAEFFPINGLKIAQGIIRKGGLINLTVTDKYGCVGTDSVFVSAKPCCDILLPDAFTPNGDGRNDRFKPIQNGHYKVSNFRVMNRWGQTVFEAANPDEGWDGTFSGALQELGTYFYYVKYICGSNEIFEKKGDVTLVR